MKAKVIIENREVQIVLTPENEFEEDIIERSNDGWDVIKTDIRCESDTWNTNSYKNHRINIFIGRKGEVNN